MSVVVSQKGNLKSDRLELSLSILSKSHYNFQRAIIKAYELFMSFLIVAGRQELFRFLPGPSGFNW